MIIFADENHVSDNYLNPFSSVSRSMWKLLSLTFLILSTRISWHASRSKPFLQALFDIRTRSRILWMNGGLNFILPERTPLYSTSTKLLLTRSDHTSLGFKYFRGPNISRHPISKLNILTSQVPLISVDHMLSGMLI